MSKYYGRVGYVTVEDQGDGVYAEELIERKYYGDVTRRSSRVENGVGLNDNVLCTNVISIVADPYAYDHFSDIRYIEWHGTLWKISSVEEQRPRLNLTLGGVYNGSEEGPSSSF